MAAATGGAGAPPGRRWVSASLLFAGGALAATGASLLARRLRRARTFGLELGDVPPVRDGVLELIGSTPMVRLQSLSASTGCEILAKLEMGNPGGSVKDRVAREIVLEALGEVVGGEGGDGRDGTPARLRRGGTVVEGTSGSTGASLAVVAASVGCRAVVVLPDDTSEEKKAALRALGAEVVETRPSGIAHPDHYVNVARRLAAERGGDGAVFADQFENPANARAHLRTGLEIVAQAREFLARRAGGDRRSRWAPWRAGGAGRGRGRGRAGPADSGGDGVGCGSSPRGAEGGTSTPSPPVPSRIDAFVAGAGTGGTLAGVSAVLRAKSPWTRVVVADPQGSGLFNLVTRGVLFDPVEAEGRRARHQVDTLVEGIGLNRRTRNYAAASVDGAERVTDREAAEMAAYLVRNEGLWVGSSGAVAAAAAAKVALRLGPGSCVVTLLCDGGHRHLSKFYNPDVLRSRGIELVAAGRGLEFLEL